MKVRLVSQDQAMHRLCRAVLLGFHGKDWDFAMVDCPEQARYADVCIWDVGPEFNFPEWLNFDHDRTDIFLIDRMNAVAFLEGRPLAAISILLKPVNDRVLRDSLEHLVARHEFDRGESTERLGKLRIERDEILQSLLYCNLKLQEFDQDRTRFLAQCVHEFRTPLMAVHGYCSILLNKQIGPLNGEQARILDRMRQSTLRLNRLTASMFEMSAGRRIHFAPPSTPGDIEGCIEQAIYETSPLRDAKNITVLVKKESPTKPILLEPSQLEQVLINLLENACRFTPRRGRIEIEAGPIFWNRRSPNMIEPMSHSERRSESSREPNAFRIEVRDPGPGIRPDHLSSIFEEFVSESAKTDLSRGGLGLSICRQIIQLHTGHVYAKSTEKGAVLGFILPYAPPEPHVQSLASPHMETMRVGA